MKRLDHTYDALIDGASFEVGAETADRYASCLDAIMHELADELLLKYEKEIAGSEDRVRFLLVVDEPVGPHPDGSDEYARDAVVRVINAGGGEERRIPLAGWGPLDDYEYDIDGEDGGG